MLVNIIFWPVIATPMFIVLVFSKEQSTALMYVYYLANWTVVILTLVSLIVLIQSFMKLKRQSQQINLDFNILMMKLYIAAFTCLLASVPCFLAAVLFPKEKVSSISQVVVTLFSFLNECILFFIFMSMCNYADLQKKY